MAIEVKVPKVAENAESGTVTDILVSEGDEIKEDDSIIVMETDKASVEIPSSDSGKVKEIKVSEGDDLSVGDVILILEGPEEEEDKEEKKDKEDKEEKETKKGSKKKKEEDKKEKAEDKEEKEDKEKKEKKEEAEGKEEEKKKSEAKEKKEEGKKEAEEKEEEEPKAKEKKKEEEKEKDKAKKEEAAEEEAKEEEEKEEGSWKEEEDEGKEVPAAPSVRVFAREIGVDLEKVDGTGPGNRITTDDVKAYAREKLSSSDYGVPKAEELPDFSHWGEVEKESISKVREITASGTLKSWNTIPHVTHFEKAEIGKLEEFRQNHKNKVEEKGGKLTVTSILTKLAAIALSKFPKFNASLDIKNKEIIYKKYYHIGIAVDTEKGLLVPVIKDVDKKNITDLAVEISEISEKARDNKLSPDDMQGGNFTISNLGGIGGKNFTPIVYHPQVAILGMSKAEIEPVYMTNDFKPKQVMPLSLSYDHRIIDGAEAARFMKFIKEAIENPFNILLETE